MTDQLQSAFGNEMFIVNPYRYSGGGSSLLSNLVSYYSLEEASGTRYDAHGSNDLTVGGTLVQTTNGVIGNDCQFGTTVSDKLYKDTATELYGGDKDFFISIWAQINTKLSPWNGLVSMGSGSSGTIANTDYFIAHNYTADRMRFYVSDGSAWYYVQADTFGSLSTSTYYYISAWHDSAANTISISINNGTADTTSSVGTLSHQTNATRFALGYYGVSAYHTGRIDEAAVVFNYIPTASERSWIYNSGSGRSYAEWAAL